MKSVLPDWASDIGMRVGSLDTSLDWNLSGQPFLTPEGLLVAATVESIEAVTGLNSQLSTAGGTSDGRFIAPAGSDVMRS